MFVLINTITNNDSEADLPIYSYRAFFVFFTQKHLDETISLAFSL